MDQYEKLMHQIEVERGNMRSRINLYRDSPLPLNSAVSNYQIPHPSAQYRSDKLSSPNELAINPSFLNYVSNQGYCPTFPIESFQGRYDQSPRNVKQSGQMLSPAIIAHELNPDNVHHLRMRAAEAEAIRQQQESNRIRKNKQKHDMFFENSTLIQNQVEHYPYGNIHRNIMEKIITKKTTQDRNNQDILLKFQKEAQQYKKSKSRHIKHMLMEPKSRHQSPDIERTQESKPLILKFQKLGQPVKQSHNIYQKHPINTMETQTEEPSFYQSYDGQYDRSPRIRHKQPAQSPIKLSSSARVSMINKKPRYHLYPLTNDGEDGLKIIRRNLRLKSQREDSQSKYQQEQLDKSKQMEELQESINSLSCMIRSNRPNLSHSVESKNQRLLERNGYEKSKFVKHSKEGNSMIDPAKMRKYMQRLSKNSDSELKQNREYLEYLSSVLE